MEIYGGYPSERVFKVEGITNEQRKSDYLVWIEELDEMVIHSLTYMAQQLSYEPVLKEIIEHFNNFETTQ
jgi:hypothetical protein